MNIINIIIVQGRSADKVMAEVDLPNPVYPYNGNLIVDFDVAADNGPYYCEHHFKNIPIKIIKRA